MTDDLGGEAVTMVTGEGSAHQRSMPQRHAQFFAPGTDGKIYTIGWESAAGWLPSQRWSAVEPGSQGFVTLDRGGMVAISRVNGQIELFAQGTDNELFKAWWS